MEEVVDLEELKERVQMIIEEYYCILGSNMGKEAQGLLEKMDKATQLAEELDQMDEDVSGKEIIKNETIQDSLMMIKELQTCRDYQEKRSQNLKVQRNNLVDYYKIFNIKACNLKQATLLLKSNKLNSKEQIKLLAIKQKMTELHKDKSMHKLFQLKKQSDDGEYVLNQVEKELGEDMKEVKEKERVVESDLIRLKERYEVVERAYEERLGAHNQRKIGELLKANKEEAKGFVMNRTFSQIGAQTGAPFEHKNEPIPTQIIYISNSYQKYQTIAFWVLGWATIIILFMYLLTPKSRE